ncbi:hypothetical protein [Azospirillum griseum]|uniref:Lipoprotein n=1 Tax=Azospirillum griseum TaxID=2496639 RepID=A0A431VFL4_9PROT|nr:hypothetical protein [Azospirillum griseum]RTR19141.1 hypothetical protein EJ903_13995 [Azospirillum griseum]
MKPAFAFLALSLPLLTGCSGEPSESEMRNLVEGHTRKALERQGIPFRAFDGFRKQGCVDSKEKPGQHDCYYAATFSPQPGQPQMTVNGKGRFFNGSKGMVFEDLGAQPR